jgi:predicted DNA-binding antitoxin AbrB/MazE fold protein
MVKAIECIYEDNVLKPVGKVPLKEGERIRVTIEKRLTFEPIQLKKKPVLRDDILFTEKTKTAFMEYSKGDFTKKNAGNFIEDMESW